MFEEAEQKLYERAAYIESLEGTVKREYTTHPDDVKNVNRSALKLFFVAISFVCLSSFALLIYGIIVKESIIIGLWSGIFIILLFLTMLFASFMRKSNKLLKDIHSEDVQLAFNSYGVVFRLCDDVRLRIYAYAWNEFECINEYEKALVGSKQGMTYIFPKRIMTQEEYDKFRRFSYASLGNKCFYKNFKQN